MRSRAKALLVCACGRERQNASCPHDFGFTWAMVIQAVGGSRGRQHEGVERAPGKWCLPLLSAVSWAAEAVRGAQSSLCSLPDISPGRHVQSLEQIRCRLLARWKGGAELPATWCLPGVRLVQSRLFAALLLSASQGFAQKGRPWPSRALYRSSAAPPAYPVSLYRSCLAAAARCRSCVGQEAACRSVAAPRPSQSCLR